MKQAELAHYRAMLQTQAVEPPRRGLFAAREKAAYPATPPQPVLGVGAAVGPPPQRSGSLFGRRPPEPAAQGAEPLVLDLATAEAPRLRLRRPESSQLAETPFHAEDLADPPSPRGPAPGIIAGWSNVKPPSAQVRLLRRLGAVIEAERQGLAARLEAAGVAAA